MSTTHRFNAHSCKRELAITDIKDSATWYSTHSKLTDSWADIGFFCIWEPIEAREMFQDFDPIGDFVGYFFAANM
jgi:hypothetical protein